MKKTAAIKRLLLALFVLLLLAGIVALFRPSNEGSIGHTVKFSDGTTMTLRAVTCGTQHQYLGGGWQQRLGSLLPRRLAAMFASKQAALTTGRPSIAFWFERIGNGPTTGDPRLVLCDANDFGIRGSPSLMRMGAPGTRIEGYAFESWPRRGRTFTLRIYELAKQYPEANSIGEFTIRNPAPGKYPAWNAPEPPVTGHDGDLSATLFDLTAGVGFGATKWKPAHNPTVAETRAGFRLERNGVPTTEWEIASVESSDATSNVVSGIRSRSPGPDAEYVELEPYLWPAEQAWKLRVGFAQRSNFVASQLWTLPRLPLSGTEFTNAIVAKTNLQGASLEYVGMVRQSESSDEYEITFRRTPGPPDYRLTLVRALDDQGREVEQQGLFESPRSRGFPLQVNSNATSLDLTLALHRTRYIEFLARPRVISTNEMAPR